MKYPTHGPWLLALSSTLLLAACQTESQGSPPTSTSPKVERAVEGPAASQSANREATDKSQVQTQPAAAPKKTSARTASSTLAYPTGDSDTSAILIERFMPPEATAGLPTEYETVVTNLAPIALDNVTVSETIDGNFSISSTEPKISSTAGGVNSWNLGRIAANQAVTIRVKGTAKNVPSISNCTSVTYASAACAAFPVTLPALQLAATGTLEGLVCDELLYKYTVTNQGTAPATNVKIEVVLPGEAEYVNATGKTATAALPGADKLAFLPVATIATGEKVSWHIHAKGTKAGDGRLKVAMTSNELKSPVEETEATFFYDPR